MNTIDQKTVDQLIQKSHEAFIMGLEIFNKPTLKYRVEGFTFFICNAWELMLKAEMMKRFGNDSIYYVDNPSRTLSISDVTKKIFTNNKDPLRRNLEKIVELRNVSAHFVTEEYGIIYAPLFQACVINFRNKMNEFHQLDVAASIPENFLTLSVNVGDFTNESIRAKYSPELAEKLIGFRNDLAILEREENNPKFSISIEQRVYVTKKQNSADFTIAIDNKSQNKIKMIKELKDPSNTHNYSFNNVLDAINSKIESEKIPFIFTKPTGEVRRTVTKNDLTLFMKFYDIKNNVTYCYAHKTNGKIVYYTYAPALVDFIILQIKNDPVGVIGKLKKP